jgi:hypothetical protein
MHSGARGSGTRPGNRIRCVEPGLVSGQERCSPHQPARGVPRTTTARLFRGFRFPAEVALGAVRRYLQFPLGCRGLELRLRPDDRLPARHPTFGSRWVSAPTHAEPAPNCPLARERSQPEGGASKTSDLARKKAATGIDPSGSRDWTGIPPGARAAVRPGRLRLARECRHAPRRGAPGSTAGSPGVPAAGARGSPSHGPAQGHTLLASSAASARPARLAHDLAASPPTRGHSAAIVPAPGQILRADPVACMTRASLQRASGRTRRETPELSAMGERRRTAG